MAAIARRPDHVRYSWLMQLAPGGVVIALHLRRVIDVEIDDMVGWDMGRSLGKLLRQHPQTLHLATA